MTHRAEVDCVTNTTVYVPLTAEEISAQVAEFEAYTTAQAEKEALELAERESHTDLVNKALAAGLTQEEINVLTSRRAGL
jgi:hypothetical protein